MAKKKVHKDASALKRRYGHRLAELREQFIEAAGENISRRLKREKTSDYQLMKRQLSKETARLKRGGFLPKSTDARKPSLTAYVSRKLNALYEFLRGTRKPRKVAPEVARKLKEQGYPVESGRVLLGDRYQIVKGEVREKRNKMGGPGRRVSMIRLNADVHRQAEALLAGLKPDEYVGFELGAGYTQLFGKGDLYTSGPTIGLLDYLGGAGSFDAGRSMKYLTVHYIMASETMAYYMQKEASRQNFLDTQREKRRARRKKQRDQRSRNKG